MGVSGGPSAVLRLEINFQFSERKMKVYFRRTVFFKCGVFKAEKGVAFPLLKTKDKKTIQTRRTYGP